MFCTSGLNLVILAWIGGELWCGQAQNGVNPNFKLNLTLQVRAIYPQIIGILIKVFYTSGPNLVILVWMSEEVSCTQTHGQTDGRTDMYRQAQAMTTPKGQKWPRIKGCHGLRWWLVACLAPSHYLNQCWFIFNRSLGTNYNEILIKYSMFSNILTTGIQ